MRRRCLPVQGERKITPGHGHPGSGADAVNFENIRSKAPLLYHIAQLSTAQRWNTCYDGE